MSSQNTKPMNLLYIFSDQHNKTITGCYGNPHVHTPNLDKLAANGVRFDNAYTNSPICVPARASMTIGDYCFRHSYWDNAHPYEGKEEGWGHRLTQQGYKVTTIGKLHYKDNIPETGFPDQRIPMNVKGAIGDLTQTIRDGSMVRPFLKQEVLTAGVGDSDYLLYDKKTAQLAADFLKNEATLENNPWCLYVGFVCPHFPWKVPQEIMDLYTPYDKIPMPAGWSLKDRSMHPAIVKFREELCINDGEISDEDMRKVVATYYGMVTYLDQQIGMVLDALEAAGLAENTRIIYASDHGDAVGENGLFFKHTMVEGSVGIPLIMSGPDLPKGTSVESCVSLVDMFPTILESVGADRKPEDMDLPGMSLLPLAKGEIQIDRPVFSETHCIGFNDGVFMLRYKQYKYIYYINYEPQLFDLEKDPHELVDLIHNPEYSDIVNMMDEKLRDICDPEETDQRAKKEQMALLEQHGGKEKVMKNILSFSPIPDSAR